jgi:hypothetical protein
MEEKDNNPIPFEKKSSLFGVIPVNPWWGLPAYLLGKQGVRDAMFLPVILEVGLCSICEDYKQ